MRAGYQLGPDAGVTGQEVEPAVMAGEDQAVLAPATSAEPCVV